MTLASTRLLHDLLDRELAKRGIIPRATLDDLPEIARISARLEPRLARAFRDAVEAARGSVTLEEIEAAVRAGNAHQAILLFEEAGIWSDFLEPAKRALTQAVLAGATVAVDMAPELGFESVFNLVNHHAVEWAANESASFVTEIGDAQRMTLRGIFEGALSGDRDVRDAAKLVRNVVGLTSRQAGAVDSFWTRLTEEGVPSEDVERRTAKYAAAQLKQRGETIARTEILDASNEGQQSLWEEAKKQGLLNPEKTRRVWIVTHDDRLDLDICEPLDEAEATLDGPFPGGYYRPPAHPRCLPAGALIFPGPKITGQTERMYEGELCILRTASGQRLAVTPNHPVLTPRGWTAANRVHEVGYVIGGPLCQRVASSFNLDHQDMPARVEEIAQAFHRSQRVSAAAAPTAREDFHGDGLEGEIAIVRSDRFLLHDGQPTPSEHARKLVFVGAGVKHEALARRRMQEALGGGLGAPSGCVVRRRDLPYSLLRRHARPFRQFRLGAAANRFGALAQSAIDDATIDAEISRQLLDGRAGPITVEKIVNVECVPFHGLVYNLQTTRGWYIANGIISHNCRCAVGLKFLE